MPSWSRACRSEAKKISSSLAVDWSDIESFSRPPPKKGGDCADPEASWGRRHANKPGPKDELFFGYYFSLATMVDDEGGPAVPELVRAMTLSSCRLGPGGSFVPVLEHLCASGVLDR